MPASDPHIENRTCVERKRIRFPCPCRNQERETAVERDADVVAAAFP